MNNLCGLTNRLLVVFFCFALILNSFGQENSSEEQRISGLLAKIVAENRTVEELTENNLNNLPIGIIKTISGTKITIAIDSAKATPQGMLICAYTQIKLPGSTKPISFAAKNVLITPSGISQSGGMQLAVISKHEISINDKVKLILPADGQNYVTWDCNGFRSVNLGGIFEFSGEYFIPDPDLSRNKTLVTAAFEVNTSDLNNILVSTSITPFRIKGLGEMTFVVNQASVDMSDFANCDGFIFPEGYQNLFSDAPQLWRGFFIKEFKVLLPSELSSSTERTSISARNLLIDEFGVSGYFTATNILTIDKGSALGWPFSVDMISIGLTQNKLSGGAMGGVIGVPFLGSDTLGYHAQIVNTRTGLQYSFSVKTNDERNYTLPLGATIKLGSGCIFEIKLGNGKFIPSAMLNGSLSLKKGQVDLDNLRFEKLHLTAERPYILGGKFSSSFDSGFKKIAGFGLGIDSISLGVSAGKAFLGFNVKVALMGKDEKGISASTKFMVTALVETVPDLSNPLHPKQKWVYGGLFIQKVVIKGNVSIFSIDGGIDIFKDHPVYGNGFHGQIKLSIAKIMEEPAEVEIYFGTKEDYKYWFARIDIPVTIPIGIVTLKKLGGGVYNNMERLNLYEVDSDYIPKRNSGLGFMTHVGLNVKSDKILYADVSFEIAFNSSNGVRFIRFAGEGQFFSSDAKKDEPPPVTAALNMVFDFEHDIFHANLKVYMNIPAGIKGIGPEGLLGEAVIHCDPSDWYIYIGRPSIPLGIDVMGLLRVQSYFMAGTKLENMPLPPSEVASVIGNIDMDFMKSEREVATGRGVAFGLRFDANGGFGKERGFVYAYFSAGAGADIMLQNYGTAQCAGRSGPIGINGWYASGQAYAYIIGKIGVRVKKSEFDIMSVTSALLLQAKMPNPSWFQGSIAARYNILGGLIKGKVNVAVTLGEECVLITNGNELGELKLIGDITPADGNSEVDVFAAPQVSFNTTIDKEFGMVNIADQYAVYRVRLDHFKLLTSDNQAITGTVRLNTTGDMATLKMLNILPGNQRITTSVKVHIEKKARSGSWETLTGDPEVSEATFTTGDEPKSVPANNVAFSYPLKNQYNFYRSEYPNGYIKLISGQPNLFNSESEGTRWGYTARFKTSAGTVESSATYSDAETMVYFDIPKTLTTSVVYDMSIVKKPLAAGAMDSNLLRSEVVVTTNSNDSLSMAKNQITGSVTAETETILHSFSFRSSMYSTFTEKLNDISSSGDQFDVVQNMSLIGVKLSMKETFDTYELKGQSIDFEPLVYAEAQKGTPWIENHVFPQVYELYGTIPGITLSRNTDILGLLPLKGITISNPDQGNYLLQGDMPTAKSGVVTIWYMVPQFMYSDFSELRNKAASLYMGRYGVTPPQAQRLIAGNINNISHGTYPFKISYRLPGLNIITSSKDFKRVY